MAPHELVALKYGGGNDQVSMKEPYNKPQETNGYSRPC